MTSLTETPPARKPTKAYHAHYLGLSGAILQPADHVVFVEAESGATITLAESDYPNLVVLGEVAESTVQHLEDRLRGSAVGLVCNPAWRLSREL